ncbi:Aste57867_11241 [Aphanomyces stellatus]|uniref:Aste57867_11241 protein n=1 Tax=Aphanomyces stellatus TaxID=120398 RepID=A0A485KSD6_9STRA|nr:hypothetical protein As57867_011199 [Aphanomyces stellatus]VFT88107.1 Aste57867_11241 [Aphanomyces stellatus]
MQVPVAPDFFQCPPLPPHEIDKLVRRGEQAAQDLVAYTRLSHGPLTWTPHTTVDKVKLFTTRIQGLPAFCGHVEIQATLDDVRSIFLAPTTATAREITSIFFPNMLDIVELYRLVAPNRGAPHTYLGLHWFLLESPLKGFILKNRDFCHLEYQHDTTIDGKRAWVRAFKHVELPNVPPMNDAHGVIRGHLLLSGFVYIETDCPGVLTLLELHHNQYNGLLHGTLGDLVAAKGVEIQSHSMQSFVRFLRIVQLGRRRRRLLLADDALVPTAARSHCAVCRRAFGLFGRKTNCRRCGEVVCGRRGCSTEWRLCLGGGLKTHVCVCEPCTAAPVDGDECSRSDQSRYSDAVVLSDENDINAACRAFAPDPLVDMPSSQPAVAEQVQLYLDERRMEPFATDDTKLRGHD